MSPRHSIRQENSQPRHMHRSTYDRKIWLLMTPSSLDGLTATYTPQKRSTFFALTIPSKWSPSPTYQLLVFPKILASDTETYGIGAQWIRISIFNLSVAATNTFRWTWDSSWPSWVVDCQILLGVQSQTPTRFSMLRDRPFLYGTLPCILSYDSYLNRRFQ